MKKEPLFSVEDVHKTYRDIHNVLITGWIIRQYSSNTEDVRDCVLENLDLSRFRHILEPGCGYGFFTEKLKGRLHPEADITGIDIVRENRYAYLNTVHAMQFRGGFIPAESDCITHFSSSGYDMVIASYSLYFFPHLIPFISRVLKKGGLFLALTHSKDSLGEAVNLLPPLVLEAGGEKYSQSAMTRLFHKFSLENGHDMLKDYFSSVDMVFYENTMFFPDSAMEDCLFYLETKKNLLYKDILHKGPVFENKVREKFQLALKDFAKQQGGISLQKNDAAFLCWK